MNASLAQSAEFEALRALEAQALELREFLEALPSHLTWERYEEMRGELRDRCARLMRDFPRTPLDERVRSAWASTQERLSEMHAALASCSPRERVQDRYDELSRAYEQWVTAFGSRMRNLGASASPRSNTLKPLIRARTLFHIGMGVGAVALYQFLLTPRQATIVLLSVLGMVVGLEVTRRIWARWNHILLTSPVFQPIARPREYKAVNSASWYVLALCLVQPFFSRPAVCAAVLVLALADPAAAWIGRRFGTRKLFRRKSWVGTATFAVTGFLAAIGYLFAFHASLGATHILGAAALCSIAGAIAELFSDRIDDNIAVPIAGVLAAAILI